jgi:hypothetical protein
MQRFLLVLMACCFLLSACGGSASNSQIDATAQAINEIIEEQYTDEAFSDEEYTDEEYYDDEYEEYSDEVTEEEDSDKQRVFAALEKLFDAEQLATQLAGFPNYQLQLQSVLGEGDQSINLNYVEQSEGEVLQVEREEFRGSDESKPNILFYQDGVVYELGLACSQYNLDATTARNNINSARSMILMTILEVSMFDNYRLAESGLSLHGQTVDKYQLEGQTFGNSTLWINADGQIMKIEADLNIGQGPKNIKFDMVPSEQALNLTKPSAC